MAKEAGYYAVTVSVKIGAQRAQLFRGIVRDYSSTLARKSAAKFVNENVEQQVGTMPLSVKVTKCVKHSDFTLDNSING